MQDADKDFFGLKYGANQLLFEVYTSIWKIACQDAAPFHIGASQLLMLGIVIATPGVHQEILGECLNLDKSTIAKSLKKMVELGLVNKTRGSQDKRMYHIYPTDKAHAIKDKVWSIIQSHEQLMIRGLSQEEIGSFIRVSEKILANIKDELSERKQMLPLLDHSIGG